MRLGTGGTNERISATERRRARNYDRGNHWDEEVEDPDNPGVMITEKELILRQNRIPWVINQLGAIVRNLRGQFRQNMGETAAFAVDGDDSEAVNAVNVALRSIKRENRLEVLRPDGFYEHILSGQHCWRIDIAWNPRTNRDDVRMDLVDNTRLFFNLDVNSRRLDDLRMIGQLHDLTSDQVVQMFAVDESGNYDPRLANELFEGMGHHRERPVQYIGSSGFDRADTIDFYRSHEPDMHRIVEMWHQRSEKVVIVRDPARAVQYEYEGDVRFLEEESSLRVRMGYPPLEWFWRMEKKWHVTFSTPDGYVLNEQRTPYWHDSHPYVLGLANLVDGETWGLVHQIIDPQRWLNRLISMVDFSLASSAKGVLMVPEDSIPDGMDIDDFAEVWGRSNGVVKIKVKPGAQIPQQISANAIPGGTFQILQNLQTWMDTTSGVTGPLRGVDPASGTPAALFQQQITQSTVTNLGFFESFFETERERDLKVIQVAMQAYRDQVAFADTALRGQVIWNPDRVRKLRLDVSMANVGDTATYRQLFEADLQSFLSSGFLNFAEYLQASSHPKAESLMKLLQNQNPGKLQQSQLDLDVAADLARSQGAVLQQSQLSGPNG